MSGKLEITILGCGSSGGVPRVGGDWGACDPNEPKNQRRRCSILVEKWENGGKGDDDRMARTSVLVDTAPDLRCQLLDADVQHIDALLYTHDHGDQTHGIDDLRAVAYRQGKRIPTYMDEITAKDLLTRFSYCFEKPEGRVHAPILDLKDFITPGHTIVLDGPGGTLKVNAFVVGHGGGTALGFVFNEQIAYSPDAHTIPDETLQNLMGLECWIVDALRYHPHPTHAHIDKALHWGAETQTRKLIFTNLHIDMDYQTLKKELMGPHEPAYDGKHIMMDEFNISN